MNMQKIRKIYSIVLALVVPVLGYLLFETTTGNLAFISPKRALLNIAFYYLIYAFVYLCCNRFRIAAMGTSIVLYGIAVVDYFVLQFRGTPLLLPQDITAWRTAAAVAANYTITFTGPVLKGAVCLLVLLAALFFVKLPKFAWKKRLLAAGIYLVIAVSWITAFYETKMKSSFANIVEDVFWWSLPGSYQDFGYAVSTAILIESTIFEKPEGYSLAAVEEIAADTNYEREAVSEITPENIIMVMNESFSDYRMIRDFEMNQEMLPFISSLNENTIKSDFYVQVFGGGTSNTEYEALTGNSMSFLPYVISAYQAYSKPEEYGLASTLKAQGYTTVAMHPNVSGNWNRKAVYQHMGFDEFVSSSGYRESARLRDYVSDQANYERLIQRYEEKAEGEKFFVFNVTMQNHGGYDKAYPDFEEKIWATGEMGGDEEADRVLSLMYESDQAFSYLVNYFAEVDEPTMIVMFGDHQASIGTDFYEKLFGKSLKELAPNEADMRYVTPLIIWTNYEIEEIEIKEMSANYLGSKVLELANLEMSAYNEFLLKAWKEAPILGKNGYYMADGSYTPWSSDAEYPDILKKYQLFEYNYVADRKHRLNDLFTAKSQKVSEVVVSLPEEIPSNEYYHLLHTGDEVSFDIQTKPAGALAENLTFESSAPEIVSVDETGKIEVKQPEIARVEVSWVSPYAESGEPELLDTFVFSVCREKDHDTMADHELQWYEESCLIAHALGNIDDHTYTNSLEALEESIAEGYKTLEVDLALTSDDEVVCRHTWYSDTMHVSYDGTVPDLETFEKEKIFGYLTPLSGRRLLEIWGGHPELYFVLDVKQDENTNFLEVFEKFVELAREMGCENLLEQVIVQLYDIEDYDKINMIYPVKHWLFTTYQLPEDSGAEVEAAAFAAEKDFDVLTVPAWCMGSDYFIDLANEYNLPLFTHTVNEIGPVDKSSERGIYGFYTDFLAPNDLKGNR